MSGDVSDYQVYKAGALKPNFFVMHNVALGKEEVIIDHHCWWLHEMFE